jgi:hypothetical protein
MSITQSIFYLFIFYFSVALKTYCSYRRAGLFKNPEHRKIFLPFIFFWPAYINPFKRVAEKIFQNYGDKGHIYTGWKGLKNFITDLTKGKDRYSDYKHHSFVCATSKFDNPTLGKFEFINISISKKEDTFLLNCLLLENESHTSNEFSNYDLDDSPPMNQQQLVDELKKCNISDQDIEKILKTVSK